MEICDAHNDFLTAVKEKQKRVEIVDNFVLNCGKLRNVTKILQIA